MHGILLSHPILVSLHMHLFNDLILLGANDAFGIGGIVPLIKNNDVDGAKVDNYQGIIRLVRESVHI